MSERLLQETFFNNSPIILAYRASIINFFQGIFLNMADSATTPGATKRPYISLIVPYLNEQDSLAKLVELQQAELRKLNLDYEIILIDDGSSDNGTDIAKNLAGTEERVKLIHFTRNFGKASALSAGFARAKGDIMITMDADLQDDPAEIPNFIDKIQEGYDVVSGWKKSRNDPIGKRLPSLFFNGMVQATFGMDIHDINCGFKAYSQRAAKALNLYGELHRFTPALLFAKGFSVTEIVVNHNSREFGVSKYGFTRMFKGFLDLITVKLMTRYRARPLHFFALLAMPFGLLGIAMLMYLTILWFAGLGPIGNRPLLLIAILFIITATQLIGIGLTAELVQTSRIQEPDKYVIQGEYGFTRSSSAADAT
jgi:glycosyltransferase involved in cell wall biosynthesis